MAIDYNLFYAGEFNNNFDTIISNQQQIKILHTYCTCKQCPNKSTYQYIYYSNGPYRCDCEYCINASTVEFIVDKVIPSGIQNIDIINVLIEKNLLIECKHCSLELFNKINDTTWYTSFE